MLERNVNAYLCYILGNFSFSGSDNRQKATATVTSVTSVVATADEDGQITVLHPIADNIVSCLACLLLYK